MFNNIFKKIVQFEIMSRNMVEPERPQKTTQYSAFALHAWSERLHARTQCTHDQAPTCTHAPTREHTQYLILLFHGSNGFANAPQYCVIRTWPVLSHFISPLPLTFYNTTGNVSITLQARSHNHCCRGKALTITYSESVSVALLILHTKRMRRFILSSVACPALLNFFNFFFSHKRHNFRGKKLLNIKCMF